MKRRTLLASGGAGAAASTLPSTAPAKAARELRLVCSFGPAERFELLGRMVTEASAGRLRVRTYYPGELVDSLEVFDAVSEGLADMYWSAEYYWVDRSPAFNFFAAVPFGLAGSEMVSWLQSGGGQALWDELSGRWNIKPLALTHSGYQMGGWFKRELESVEGFRGLRIRMPGLGGEILRRLGAVVVNLPPRDIVSALHSGALDAAEWVGPENDLRLGLHTAARYYYYPGFQEPALVNSLGINKAVWESLDEADRSLLETAAAAAYTLVRARGDRDHVTHLARLLGDHGVQLRRFDDGILRACGEMSAKVVAELGARDPFTERVYESYIRFLNEGRAWTDISVRAFLEARALAFPYGR